MKKILTIIFVVSTLLATAQSNRLVSASNQWNTKLSFGFSGNTQTRKYTFSVDSFEMGGLYYRQLLFANEEDSDNWSESGEWWREEAGIVYKYTDAAPVPFYDFTLSVNDTFSSPALALRQLVVYKVDTVNYLDDTPRKRLWLHCSDDPDGSWYGDAIWVEDIGDLLGLEASDSHCLLDQPYNALLCFYQTGDLIYADPDSEGCWITATAEPTSELANISPNPTSTQLTLTFVKSIESDAELAIFSPLGQLVYQKKLAKGSKKYELDVESIPAGIYTLVLSNGGTGLAYERLVVTH